MAAERPKWAMRLSEHPQSREHEHPIKTVLSTISCQMSAKSRTLTFSNKIRKETWCPISSLRAVSICSVQKPIHPNEQRCFLENTSSAPRCTVTTALMSLLWEKKTSSVRVYVCVYTSIGASVEAVSTQVKTKGKLLQKHVTHVLLLHVYSLRE